MRLLRLSSCPHLYLHLSPDKSVCVSVCSSFAAFAALLKCSFCGESATHSAYGLSINSTRLERPTSTSSLGFENQLHLIRDRINAKCRRHSVCHRAENRKLSSSNIWTISYTNWAHQHETLTEPNHCGHTKQIWKSNNTHNKHSHRQLLRH